MSMKNHIVHRQRLLMFFYSLFNFNDFYKLILLCRFIDLELEAFYRRKYQDLTEEDFSCTLMHKVTV